MSVAYDEPDLLAHVRSLAWLDQQVFPPLQWAVPGLIPEGFGLLVGPPKLGKSWFTLSVGLSVAIGGRALGRIDVDQRPVLYLALEDGDRRLQDRARKLMAGQALPAAFDYVTRSTPAEVVHVIAAWLDQHRTGLVMLDTLGRVMPPANAGETSYMRDYRIGSVLKNLVDTHPGSTLLVVHHVRKAGSEDFIDTVSGTAGLAGSADWTIALTRTRNDDQAVIRVTGRDVREDEYAARVDDGTWTLSGASLAEASAAAKEHRATAGLGDTSADVVAFVNAHPEGVRPAEVAAELNIDAKTAATYLGRLAENDRIRRRGRGVYGPAGSVESVGSVESGTSTPNGFHTPNTFNTPGSVRYLPGMQPTCTECGLPIDPAAGTIHPGCDS